MRILDERRRRRSTRAATTTTEMVRSFEELVDVAPARQPGPAGLRPPHRDRASCRPSPSRSCPGHWVEIHVPEIGTLANPVVLAGDLVRGQTKGGTDDGDGHEHACAELRRRRVARGRRATRRTRSATPGGPTEVTGVVPGVGRRRRARRGGRPPRRRPPGRALPAPARGAFLAKAADALEARVEQVAQDMTAEMGKPLREARHGGGARRGDPPLRRRRGVAPDRRGLRGVGAAPAALHGAPPARRRRADHARGTSRSRSRCGSSRPR